MERNAKETRHALTMEEGRGKPSLAEMCTGERTSRRVCCKRVLPWVLFTFFISLTVVLLVLFLVFEDPNSPPVISTSSSPSALCIQEVVEPHRGIDLRVSGGRPTDIESWPWMASLRDQHGSHMCGATLIGDRWLLTAAHCLENESSRELGSVVMGDTSLAENSSSHVTRNSFRIYMHDEFDAAAFTNDIAVVRFDPPVGTSIGVSPACLNDDTREMELFTTCYVLGWGKTSFSDFGSTILQEGRVPLVPLDECTKAYAGRHHLSDHVICAVSSDAQVDTCKGDSGGPLMCRDNATNAWSVVGVTSFGYGCNTPTNPAPGVYSRVSWYFSTFIKAIVEDDTDQR
ncbi:chymotrypsin B-like [Diadema antillarum]|uniref:chymotrypsin B-like n=1 Tax=Diadema antillarum TaxID=105358 RepID=UPI003A86C96E